MRAINIVQTQMGITGATAAEAADTIEGSIASTKAAWENVLTAIGTGKGMQEATKNLVDSARNVIKNVKPVIQRALSGIGDLIVNLAPQVVRAIPQLISGIVPGIMSTAGRLAGAITKALPKVWNGVKAYISVTLLPAVSKLIAGLLGRGNTSLMGERLSKTFGSIFDKAVAIVEGIGKKVSEFWTRVLQPILGDIVEFVLFYVLPAVNNLMDKLSPVLTWIGDAVSGLFENIAGWWESIMVPILAFMAEHIETIVPMVAAVVAGIAAFAIAKKINNIITVVKGLFTVLKAHPIGIIIGVIAAAIGYVIHLYQTNEEARDKINAAFEAIKGFWEGTLKPAFEDVYKYVVETLIPALIEWWDTKLKPTIENVFTAIKGFWTDTLKPALEELYTYVVETLIPALIEWWDTKLKPTIETVFTAIVGFWNDTLKPALQDIYTYVVTDLIPTLIVWWEYHLKPTIETVFTAIAGFWNDTLKPAFEEIYTYVTETLIPTLIEWWDTKLKPTIETVFSAIAGFWNDTLKPAFEEIYTYVTETLIPTLQEKWEAIKPIIENVFTAIKTFWEETAQPALQAFWDFINDKIMPIAQSLGEKFNDVWETYLKPVGDWLVDSFMTYWDGLQTQMSNLLTFITSVFSGDWSAAWDALVAMVATPFNTLKDILKTPINAVIDLLNGLISKVRDALNTVIDFINSSLSISIPSVTFDANPFSDTFGVHTDSAHPAWSWNPGIGRINWADNVIPKLAGGGIVYNGGEAIVGEYKPEHLRVVNGKAVVTPLNTGRFPGGQEMVEPRTQTPRMLNVTLKIRDTEIARVLLPLLEAEEQRVGVKLSKGGAY